MSVVEQSIPAGTWKADGLHSSVRFEVEHMGVSTFGAGFTDYEASCRVRKAWRFGAR